MNAPGTTMTHALLPGSPAIDGVTFNPTDCDGERLAAWHAAGINRVFTPTSAEIAHARRIVAAFERARAAGRERASVDGALVEVPIYAAAKRLLESP